MDKELATFTTSGVVPVNAGCVQLITFGGDLIALLNREGAKTQAAAAAPALLEVLKQAKKDPVLSGLDWNMSPALLVYWIATKGTPIHRMALGKYLTPAACAYFPTIEIGLQSAAKEGTGKGKETTNELVKFLCSLIEETADYFGVQVSGNKSVLAYSIIGNYTGLTIADVILFFERLKNGQYKTEYQNIAVRGINADFLNVWLTAYIDERTLDVQANYEQYKEPKAESGGLDIAKLIAEKSNERKRKQAALQLLESDAEIMRARWRTSIMQTNVTGDGVPVSVFTETGVENELQRLAFEFLFEDVAAYIQEAKYKHGNNFDFMAKRIIYEVGSFLDKVNPFDLCCIVVCKVDGNAFHRQRAYQIMDKMGALYIDHLKSRIEKQSTYPPLTKQQFAVKYVLHLMHSNGMEIPTTIIFKQ